MNRSKLLLKKERGIAGVLDFVPLLIVIIMCAYMLIQYSYNVRFMDMLNRLENLSQKYILIMGTENGLKADELDKFYEEIERIGIPSSNVDFAGTTFWDSSIEYGDEIYLMIKAKIPACSVMMGEDMNSRINYFEREVNIEKCAIALG